MALIILYFLASILIFIGVEPFKTVGIFLSICYLPGLSVLTLSKKDKLLFEDLILAFSCSIGISSGLILGLLFVGIHVKYVPIVIHTGVGIGVFFHIITRIKHKAYSVVEVTNQELIFSLFTLLITLLLSIPIFLGPNRFTIANHVFFHSAIVTEILNGNFPPGNPGLGGARVGYYWGFHSLIAAITAKSDFQQGQIMFALNILSLYMLFCIAYNFAKAFGLSEGYRYILPLAVIGLMRSDTGILFISRLFSRNISLLGNITTYPVHPYDILKSWISGLPWFDSRLFFLNKYYNISGMPLAISLCVAYFLLLFQVLKKRTKAHKVYLLSVGIVILACFLNYPPLAIIPLFHAPIWACFIFLASHGHFKEKASETLKILFPYFIAVLFALPYLLYIIKGGSGGQKQVLGLDFYSQSIKNLIVFLIPFPIIIYGFWIAFKRLSFTMELLFILIGTFLCLSFSAFSRLPLDDSYKFNYILTFFLALLFVFALSGLLPQITQRLFKKFIAAGIVFFLLLTPLIVEASYIGSYFFHKDFRYIFSKKHIVYAKDVQRNEAYKWIRENTPPESLIMLSYTETHWPCCALNMNYETAAIAERSLYVIKDIDFTTIYPEYEKRIELREKLFKDPDDPEVINYFVSLKRPVYLLVEKESPDNRFTVEDGFKTFPENPGQRFLLVFRNERQRVYLIRMEQKITKDRD